MNTENEAQRAANVVFRLLRDMMSNQETNRVEEDLRTRASEAEQDAVNLWRDPNVMVAFFSRISPIQKLNIRPGTFMLRLQQEGVLPDGVCNGQSMDGVLAIGGCDKNMPGAMIAIALVQPGDTITIDAAARLLHLDVSATELERRRAACQPPKPRYTTGVLAKYAKLVSSSSIGAVIG